MKCPRCGSEMTFDTHRKYNVPMCYECGYIEGRSYDKALGTTNFAKLKAMNFNEAAAFLSKGLGLDEDAVDDWLNSSADF